MGYYDFNEHFWSPEEVCCEPSGEEAPQQVGTFRKVITAIVSIGTLAVFLIP